MGSDLLQYLEEDKSNWWVDRMYLQDAFWFATHSDAERTQVGSLLVLPNNGPILSAWNCTPQLLLNRGFVPSSETKNHCMEHAERGVLYKALKNGLPTEGLWMYGTWAACSECSRALIEFGVSRVVTSAALVERTPDRWVESMKAGLHMMRCAGIQVVGWRGDLGIKHTIRFDSQTITNEDLK